MATDAQVEQLRRLIAEPDDCPPFTEQVLKERIDASDGNLTTLAADIWLEKASSAATLVDISESGSSRSMSKIHDQALAMSKQLRAQADLDTPTAASRSRTRSIARQ
jgi:hypothetical protein